MHKLQIETWLPLDLWVVVLVLAGGFVTLSSFASLREVSYVFP